MNQKGQALIFLLVGIIVLAAIGGAFYLGRSTTSKPSPAPVSTSHTTPLPTQNANRESNGSAAKPVQNGAGETANWKTYADPALFFQYPSDWEVQPPYIESRVKTIVEFRYKLTTLFTLSEIAINEQTGKRYTSLNEYVGPRLDTTKDITIGNYPAKKISVNKIPKELVGHVIPYEEVVFLAPDKSYLVSLHYEKDTYYDKPNADKVLDQILSTFKFTQ